MLRAEGEPHRARALSRWPRAAFFEWLRRAGLDEYDELEGIEWERQAVDGVVTKASLDGGETGANPTDCAKSGTKRSVMSGGADTP
ncbi:MAG: hypothetical protein H0T57_15710 [Rubrobacter sp.]|nr:hypothetical protein [Rubrobacter sp.]